MAIVYIYSIQRFTYLLIYLNTNQWISAAWIIRSGQGIYYAIMIGSSTYVGMITVVRALQVRKASLDMVTREVGRDRLVSQGIVP